MNCGRSWFQVWARSSSTLSHHWQRGQNEFIARQSPFFMSPARFTCLNSFWCATIFDQVQIACFKDTSIMTDGFGRSRSDQKSCCEIRNVKRIVLKRLSRNSFDWLRSFMFLPTHFSICHQFFARRFSSCSCLHKTSKASYWGLAPRDWARFSHLCEEPSPGLLMTLSIVSPWDCFFFIATISSLLVFNEARLRELRRSLRRRRRRFFVACANGDKFNYFVVIRLSAKGSLSSLSIALCHHHGGCFFIDIVESHETNWWRL